MNPLYGLKPQEALEFVASLSERDKDRLVQAIEFYYDTLSQEDDGYGKQVQDIMKQGK